MSTRQTFETVALLARIGDGVRAPLVRIALACAGIAAAGAAVAAPSLPNTPREGWAVYHVPVLQGRPSPCCHGDGAGRNSGMCDLDRDRGFSISNKDPVSKAGDELAVYLHFDGGRVDNVRALGAGCPVKQADTMPSIDGVTPATSIAFLRELAGGNGDAAEQALGAIAYHAEPSATAALIALSDAAHPRERRENALFWLGEARGKDGAAAIERVLRDDADTELRRHAVFALSLSDAIDVHAALLRIAREDSDDEVRSQALFWMGQHGDTRAAADIRAVVLDANASDDVREQGVFALSQLDSGSAEALIDLVRGNAPREVKKKAMFWLGQSDSPEATRLLDEVLANAER